MASNISLGDSGAPINWVVIPRLRADGWLKVGERRHRIERALAYHDHNWGHFAHGDFAWQWGHALPSDDANPYTVVFTRLLNRAQTSSHMDALLLWKGPRQHRVMRGDELCVETDGYLEGRAYTVPKRGRILAIGATCDVPARLRFEARGGGDVMAGTFCGDDMARIVVPHDNDLGTTLIHEVAGRLTLDGVVRGEPIALEARAVFEFLGVGP